MEEIQPQIEVPKVDGFKGINRILTGILAGAIGSGVLLGLLYLSASTLGQPLKNAGEYSIGFLITALFAGFVALNLCEILLIYFFKLIEKDIYTDLGRKIYANLVSQVVLLILTFPFLFLALSVSTETVGFLFGLYFIFSLVVSGVIRENCLSMKLVGGFFGIFLSAILMLVGFTSDSSVILLAVLAMPLTLFLSGIAEFVTEIVVGQLHNQ